MEALSGFDQTIITICIYLLYALHIELWFIRNWKFFGSFFMVAYNY